MAQGLRTNLYVSKQKIANIDNYYGPYENLDKAMQAILSDTSGLYVKNGYTFGIETNGVVADYTFKNITSGTTRNDIFSDSPLYKNYVEKKVSNATITIHQEGQDDQTFTLNQGDNVTISISKGVSTWNDIDGKPNFAEVAYSGSYDDLIDPPTIPAAQVNSDWDAVSGVAQILNKPTLSAVATSGQYSDLTGTPNLATVAETGSYNDLSNKPTIPDAQIQSDWNQSNTSAKDYIKNKPSNLVYFEDV